MTYISSQSVSWPLRTSVMQAQTALAQAQTEVSTGVKADLGLSLGAQTGLALSLQSQVDNLTSFTNSNALATTRLGATSSALDSIFSAAQKMAASLTTASSAGASTAALQSTAQAALQSLIGGLNTSAGNEFVFGGINTGATPIASYTDSSTAKQAVDAAFQSAFGTSQTSAAASTISGSDMQAFLDNQFGALFSESGWQSNWSSASSQTIQTNTGPSQSLNTSVSANESAFRQIAEAYTMLNEFTGQNLSSDAQAAVVSTASKLVNTALSGLTDLQSNVGVAQSSIESTNSDLSAQINVLTTHVGSLEDVDTATLSSQITQLQTQLEASFSLTNRLQDLSLVNYLTG